MPQFYADFNDHSLIPPQVPDLLIVTQSGSLKTIVIVIRMGFTKGGINHDIVNYIG
jgi:hypothetical protein